MTEGLATTVAPTSAPAAPAPAPVAEAPRARPDSFDSWMSTDRTAPIARVEQTPAQQPQTEAIAETMSDGDVQALDQSWAALRSAVQPAQVQAFAQAMQSGEIPSQMFGATVRYQHMGQEVAEPLSTILRDRMRLRDYGRRMGELKKAQGQLDATVSNIQQLFASWGDPNAMLDSMQRLGKFPQFEAAATQLARNRLAEARMTPEQRAAKKAQEELAARERAFNERIAALEARERGAQQAAKTDGITQQLAQWVPAAFQRHGVPDFPAAAAWFQANLDNLWEFGELTPQLVDDAVALTAMQYREAVRANTAGQQQAPQQPGAPRALPVQAMAGNASSIPAQATRQRLSNFDDHIKAQQRR